MRLVLARLVTIHLTNRRNIMSKIIETEWGGHWYRVPPEMLENIVLAGLATRHPPVAPVLVRFVNEQMGGEDVPVSRAKAG